jgi:ubiquinone/menaquinone biosynthesis C-methylase UbiE
MYIFPLTPIRLVQDSSGQPLLTLPEAVAYAKTLERPIWTDCLPRTWRSTKIDSDMSNVDDRTVAGFGLEWSTYDQSQLSPEELQKHFASYFRIFPWESLPQNAHGFDLGCGSGRWAKMVAPRVGQLHCIDASEGALTVARKNLASLPNCTLHLANVDQIPLPDESMDFGYSLGVLHHVPDPYKAMRSCVRKLRLGAPFLVYLYYAFDNQPPWYRAMWRASDAVRKLIVCLPNRSKIAVTKGIAAGVYWPLARVARLLETAGAQIESFPLSSYRNTSFYTMKTDSLDRFGTRLEHRFSKIEVREMMVQAGLSDIRFSDTRPYWCALGTRAS